VAALALFLAASRAKAETIRLTTWNLGYADSGPADGKSLEQAAIILRKIDPDVILLQHVRDWQMCAQLAEALKPVAYNVAICSSFRGPSPRARLPQTAVLCKPKAYFSWSAAWRGTETNGGYAFVAIQKGNQRLGIFSVQFDGQPDPARSVGQLLDQVSAIRRWEANRPQTFVVAGTLLPQATAASGGEKAAALLRAAGFEDAFLETTTSDKTTWTPDGSKTAVTADYILAQPTAFPLDAMVIRTAGAGHYPVTCDLELDPAKAGAAWRAHAEELERQAVMRRIEQQRLQAAAQAREPPVNPAQTTTSGKVQPSLGTWVERARAASKSWWWAAALLALPPVLLFARAWRKRRNARRLLPPAALPVRTCYTVVIAPQSTTGSTAQRLLADTPQPGRQFPTPANTHSVAIQPKPAPSQGSPPAMDKDLRQTLRRDLGTWLKQKFVSKLVSDRSQLLAAQEAATLKASKVDERLSRIERQIESQTHEYQRRIEELTRQLLAAKEENRELIRARIAQVKSEMLAARTRARSQATPEDPESNLS